MIASLERLLFTLFKAVFERFAESAAFHASGVLFALRGIEISVNLLKNGILLKKREK